MLVVNQNSEKKTPSNIWNTLPISQTGREGIIKMAMILKLFCIGFSDVANHQTLNTVNTSLWNKTWFPYGEMQQQQYTIQGGFQTLLESMLIL